jgi:hypothetical protein
LAGPPVRYRTDRLDIYQWMGEMTVQVTRVSVRARLTRAIAFACLAAVTSGVTLAGCGSSGGGASAGKPTIAALAAGLRADFQHAKSVRISGHLTEHGQPLAVDLSLLRSGDLEGTVVLGGATIRIVQVSHKIYAYVSKSFFGYLRTARHVPAATCALICGKYILLPTGTIPGLSLGQLAGTIDKHGSAPKNAHLTVTTFAGQPAYEVYDATHAAFFAKNGHHYLLGFRLAKQKIALRFSQWNSLPPIKPPPPSKIVNVG